MSTMSSQIIGSSIVYYTVCSAAEQKKNIKAPVNGEFPAQRASNAEDVSIRWRRHEQDRNQEEYY